MLKESSNISMFIYNESHRKKMEQYCFGETQFSSSPIQVIDALEENKDIYPVVVNCQEQVIGFFVLEKLQHQSIFGVYDHAILFRTFSIDANYRGNGLSKKIMNELISFVKENFPDIDTIVLSVNHKNEKAIRLYERMNYVDTGRTYTGEKGKQLVFEKNIEHSSIKSG
ncbi:GNAT family N-acetyltransferase [Niallia sp. 01092]|uniref:GNAT family N-acetyltransferase n=1 Tax=unclassified Niallia TaxID=2837522 RepID=UPI003FD236DE